MKYSDFKSGKLFSIICYSGDVVGSYATYIYLTLSVNRAEVKAKLVCTEYCANTANRQLEFPNNTIHRIHQKSWEEIMAGKLYESREL